MIFDIAEIYEEGLDFEVLESRKHFNLDSPDCALIKDVKITGRLEKTGREILCQGSLETELSVTCSRCLENFNFAIQDKLRVHFIPRVEGDKSANELELTELDVEQEFYDEGRVNLYNPVRDLILLNLPQVVLCREDCAGLCPECGTNLNEKNCDCNKEGSCDPRLAVLQQLKDKLK
jgi:uncharacterized protein